MTISRPTRYALLLAGLAAIVQLAVLVLWWRHDPSIFIEDPDSAAYLSYAVNFAAGKGFTMSGLVPDAIRPPLLTIIYGSVYHFIPRVWFLIFLQHLFQIADVILVYFLARLFLGQVSPVGINVDRWAMLPTAMFVFEAERIQDANIIMSESFYMLLFLAAVFLFLKFILQPQRLRYALGCGALIGGATLTRPIAQWYPLVFFFFIIFAALIKKDLRGRLARGGGLLLVTFLLVVSPWAIRNYIHFQSFALSPLFGYNAWVTTHEWRSYLYSRQGLSRDAISEIFTQERLAFQEKHGQALSTFSASRILGTEARKIIMRDPWSFVAFYLHGVGKFFVDSTFGWMANRVNLAVGLLPQWIFFPYLFWAGRLYWTFLYALALACFPAAWSAIKKHHLFFLAFTALIFYAAFFGSVSATPRYRLPVNPLIFIILCQLAALAYERYFLRRRQYE